MERGDWCAVSAEHACIIDCSLFEERYEPCISRWAQCDQWQSSILRRGPMRGRTSRTQFGYGPCYSSIWILTLLGLRLFLLPSDPLCYLSSLLLLVWNQFIESKEAKIDLKLHHQSYCIVCFRLQVLCKVSSFRYSGEWEPVRVESCVFS